MFCSHYWFFFSPVPNSFSHKMITNNILIISSVLILFCISHLISAKTIRPYSLQVGEQCNQNATEECNIFAYCDPTNSTCRCEAGWKKSINGRCEMIDCKTDNDCSVSSPNMECSYGHCQCQPGFNKNGTCTRQDVSVLSGTCRSSYDCGKNANCYDEYCHCRPMHYPSNEYDCEPLKCSTHNDCTDVDAHSKCELFSIRTQRICECKDDYFWKTTRAKSYCAEVIKPTKPESWNNLWWEVFVLTLAVVCFACLVGHCISKITIGK